MIVWLARHVQTCLGSLGRLASQGFATLLTVLVIGIALALPASLGALLAQTRTVTDDVNRAVELSAYLKQQATEAQAEQLATQLRGRADVADVRLIKAEQALQEFRQQSGLGDALDTLTGNPLPHTLVVRPASTETAQIAALADQIRGLPNVELVQLDTVWVERLNAILETLRRGVLIVAALLAFGVLVIVGSTIRVEIQARLPEIEIVKLIGGSDAFVRRPFLYTGFWYGLAGGLLALLLTVGVVALLAAPVRRLAGLYGSDFALVGPDWRLSLALLGIGAALGWFGSWVATARHLRPDRH
jgi:cell division transport system permease protein